MTRFRFVSAIFVASALMSSGAWAHNQHGHSSKHHGHGNGHHQPRHSYSHDRYYRPPNHAYYYRVGYQGYPRGTYHHGVGHHRGCGHAYAYPRHHGTHVSIGSHGYRISYHGR